MDIVPKILSDWTVNSLTDTHLGLARTGSTIEPCLVFVLHRMLGEDRLILDGFAQHIENIHTIRHPNLPYCMGSAQVNELPAVVAQRFEGVDLLTLFKLSSKSKIKLSTPMALFISAELAKVISFLHERRETGYGDQFLVKCLLPSTVVITTTGDVRMYGHLLIGAVEPAILRFSENAFSDSRRYLSPEVAEGKPLKPSCDVYTLGIILWELLTTRRYSSKLEYDENIPENLAVLIKQMVSLNPLERPQNVAEIEKALRTHLHSNFPKFSERHLGIYVSSLFSNDLKNEEKIISLGFTKTDSSSFSVSNPLSQGSAPKPISDAAQASVVQRGRTLTLNHEIDDKLNLAIQNAPKSKTAKDERPLPPGRHTNPELIQLGDEKQRSMVSVVVLFLIFVSVVALIVKKSMKFF